MIDHHIHFWNGNKTSVRREYEKQLLSICLQEAGMLDANIIVDETDYPRAEDEGNIFSGPCDVLVSVAGNQKFEGKPVRVIELPLCHGILGHRLLIISQQQSQHFATINTVDQLQSLTIGIPATWADADLFRHNGFKVFEKGSLEDIFERLLKQECDYVALGANEIEAIFNQYKLADLGLMIEPHILVYYPLPLVFYVHPEQIQLAAAIESGLKKMISSGMLRLLFERYHPNLVNRLALGKRNKFTLHNPHLPASLKEFCPELNLPILQR
ncbi:hypothetical protein [Glaciecola sp. SC05]|uniref:hypothetical protein n=1 Tax=Glaciecola sp. SC05 TaxID=1987355 RepID=UPI003529AA07